MEQMESTELVADFVTTAGAMGTTISQKDDKHINAPSVHIILLYLALSRSILQGAGFKHYICKRKRKFPSFKFQVSSIPYNARTWECEKRKTNLKP